MYQSEQNPGPGPSTGDPGEATRTGRPRWPGIAGAAGVVATALLAAFQPLPRADRMEASPQLERPSTRLCAAGHAGFIRGRLHGEIAGRLDWSGDALECDGMVRPGDRGIRLLFAGDLPGAGRIVLIVGIDGPHAALAGGEWPANVTLIEEGSGEFFNSGSQDRCWARIQEQSQLAASAWQVGGWLWCTGALPSLVDRSSVTPGDIHFSGQFSADAG